MTTPGTYAACVRTPKVCCIIFLCTPRYPRAARYTCNQQDTFHNFSLALPPYLTAMRIQWIWLQYLAILGVGAQQSTETSSTGVESTASSTSNTQSTSKASAFTFTNSFSTIETTIPETQFTDSRYTYATDNGQSTVTGTTALTSGHSTGASVTQSSSMTKQNNATDIIIGSSHTATTTSSAPLASNTVPCNNYAEFCNRKYSNITEVCAHNSAFSIKNNAASNQALGIVDQLDDGIRMSKSSRFDTL